MNTKKEAMRMAIMAKVMEEELFKHSKEVTITQDYYRKTLMSIVGKRVAKLLADAFFLLKAGISHEDASNLVFIKENMLNIIKNKDCDNCPAKDVCDTKEECKTAKSPSEMDSKELNDFLDNIKHKP